MRHLVGDNEGIAEEAISSAAARGTDDELLIGEKTSVEADARRCEVDIASWIEEKERNGEKFFSVELFPSKSDDKEVYERFFAEVNRHASPLFYALTWHDNRDANNRENYLPVEILRDFPSNTLLHIAGKKLRTAEVERILDDVIAQGKTNVFLLRGDGCAEGDFAHASDLVEFARKYNSKLRICVAGYPGMHPESSSMEMDLMYLKKKVDAGANFIITQIFFESGVFVEFVKNCRSRGIGVPIVPGIFPIPNYKSLQRMAELCSVKIPRRLTEDLQPIRNDDGAVRAYGIALARKLIVEIFESGTACGFHLFTLNRASIALDVCRKLY